MEEKDTNELPETNEAKPKPPPIHRDRYALDAAETPINFATAVDCLLKKPGALLHSIENHSGFKTPAILLVISAAAVALFGLILGLFSMDRQLWMIPAKLGAGLLVTTAITLPSLYIFCCLNGIKVGLRTVTGMLCGGVAMIGLLIFGLAPVTWIFSQSTDSVPFMGSLGVIFWLIAAGFGASFVVRSAKAYGVERTGLIRLWVVIFIFVTLQMTASLRPLVGPAPASFLPK
ncbi:MAG: hypothetical protein AAF226_18705, partial [Verrucomicrobiota bacterium]